MLPQLLSCIIQRKLCSVSVAEHSVDEGLLHLGHALKRQIFVELEIGVPPPTVPLGGGILLHSRCRALACLPVLIDLLQVVHLRPQLQSFSCSQRQLRQRVLLKINLTLEVYVGNNWNSVSDGHVCKNPLLPVVVRSGRSY